MRGAGFDLNGGAAPAVLLHLRHPLARHLVGVVGGAHRDLVLDGALTFQLLAAVAADQEHRAIGPRGFLPGRAVNTVKTWISGGTPTRLPCRMEWLCGEGWLTQVCGYRMLCHTLDIALQSAACENAT